MNDIKTLFTNIGNAFTQANWFAMVQWPFWILLATIAASGIHCARFGKKTLLNQAVSSTISLTAIYLTAMILCINGPFLQKFLSALPYLSITDEAVSLTAPFSLGLNMIGPQLLRLMILTLSISCADMLFVGGKTFISWFFSQILSSFFALVFYAVAIAGLTAILPGLMGRYAAIPVIIVAVLGILMFCLKFVFTSVITGGNPYFGTIYKFFTVKWGGVVITVSFFCFLLSFVMLYVLHFTGCATVRYADANLTGMLIILAMILATLSIFAMVFIDRKKS